MVLLQCAQRYCEFIAEKNLIMYVEYNQFLKLVSEACNMDLENTEKQLSLLIGEINQSLTDGEAYEIEGFGIFQVLAISYVHPFLN